MTSKAEISKWFDDGINNGQAWMIIICDTYDHEDYPVYFEDSLLAQGKLINPGSMQKVMESYDLRADKEQQLKQPRCRALKLT